MQFAFGSGTLWGVRTDIANPTPIRFGTLQEVQIDFQGEVKELYGQNQFPVDVARGKHKIMGKAKMAEINSLTFNELYFGQTRQTGQLQFAQGESLTPALVTAATSADTTSGATLTFTSVPAGVTVGAPVKNVTAPATIASGTYVVSKTSTTVVISAAVVSTVTTADSISFGAIDTVANTATYAQDLGLRYSATGLPLTYVPYAPDTGEYTKTAAGIYIVAAAAAASEFLVDYQYTAATGYQIIGANPLMGTSPRFKAVFTDQYQDNTLGLILYACISTKLTMPTKIDDYMINEFDFSAFANAAGQTFLFSSSLV
jgi:hypothetical protein